LGIIEKIFGDNSSNERESFNWIPLIELKQLEEIKLLSETKTVVIFKHSTRCGISSSVLRKFEQATDTKIATIAFFYLDLIRFRSISNEIADMFKVRHQSPQVLVIKNGNVVAHESHYDIISSLNLINHS
jgi:bacillithiol system protein YtxJ